MLFEVINTLYQNNIECSTKKDDLQKGIAHARAQIASLMEYSLPDLYHQKAQLESTGILLGDCDGQLKNQQHNLQIQHQV